MQALLIVLAIVIGILLPQGHQLTFLIRYVLMAMLFMTFLNVNFKRGVVRRDHFAVLALNILLPLVFFFIIYPFSKTVSLSVLVVGMAPTAAGAPVIADFLRSKVDSVTASVLVTSPAMALIIPLLLPLLIKLEGAIHTWDVLYPVLEVVFIPLILSYLVKKLFPKLTAFLRRFSRITFGMFLINIYIASGKATTFIRHEMDSEWTILLIIALAVGTLCMTMFLVGERIGDKNYALENSLSLGRKNTMFSIWLALTFLNPLVALGPMFYIIWQNTYNSWQLYLVQKGKG